MIEIGQISINESNVEYTNDQITLKVNNGEFQKGSITLTNQEIAWKKENTNDGFSIPWTKIVVTAISQSPQRSIYFMIDSKWIDEAPANGNGDTNHVNEDDEEEDAESGQEITEFWLVPETPSDIDNLYFFMSRYPAAGDDMDESGEDEEFFDGEDMEHMNINDDDPRFAD